MDLSRPARLAFFRRYREASVYAMVALALTAVAFFRLRRDGYVASGDSYPGYLMPGNHVLESSLPLWGHFFSGLGSPQWTSAPLVLALWGQAWLHLGVPGPTTQWLLFLALMLFAGLSTAFLARTLFPERAAIAVTAGIALPLSFYAASALPNTIEMFALGYFPFSAAFLLRRLRRPVAPLRLACEIGLLSLGFMILAATPPIAVYEVLWATAWVIGASFYWRTFPRTWLGLAVGVAASIMLNAWWLYAAFLTLYGSGGSATLTFKDPLAWSWVDQNASVLNMLSMQGSWTLPRLDYFPYDARYLSGFLRLALYVPLAFAAFGCLEAPYRRRVWLLIAIVAVSLFIGKGYHSPLGEINALLYAHLPFYWLFRDPQTETSLTLYPSLFILAGLGVSQLISMAIRLYRRWHVNVRLLKPLALATGAALTLLLLANGAIFFTGDVFPKTWLGGTAQFVSTPPAYWRTTAEFLDGQADDTRVLLLPNDDYYQMPYDWGFYGADLVASTFIRRPVLIVSPESSGWIGGSSALRARYGSLLRAMRGRSTSSIAPLLSALNVGWIIQRNDIIWSRPQRAILSPRVIVRYLAHQAEIRKVATFGKLDVYQVSVSHGYASAYDGRPLAASSTHPSWARFDATFDSNAKVLVLHSSYSPGWHVHAGGGDLDWSHVPIDGFLNGWLIPNHAPLDVSIVYAPARWYFVLQGLAIIVLTALLIGLIAYRRQNARSIP